MSGTGNYDNKGLYNRYDKNHRERDKLDYYSTPPEETLNGMRAAELGIKANDTILEPCCGGGHMVKGIQDYLDERGIPAHIIATDIHDHDDIFDYEKKVGEKYDFLSDDYPIDKADWIIMNPPYATIEPFVIRALEIADKGVLMLGRLQFLEGSGRYENILKDNPPSDVWIYVDRIQCWKGGVKPDGSSAQAYAWFGWDKHNPDQMYPYIHWLRRSDKNDSMSI